MSNPELENYDPDDDAFSDVYDDDDGDDDIEWEDDDEE